MFSMFVAAQEKYPLIINSSIPAEKLSLISEELSALPTGDTTQLVGNTVKLFAEEGYIKAVIDSLNFINDTLIINVNPGSKHFYKIYGHNIPGQVLLKANIDTFLIEKPLEIPVFRAMQKAIILHYENNGYPMASLKKEEIRFENDTLLFYWSLNKGPLYTIEEIIISGDVNLLPAFISGISRIRVGQKYSEAKIKAAAEKFSKLEFAGIAEPPAVQFTPSGVKIEYTLERLKANRFDGIAGLTTVSGPNNENSYRISGQMNLNLINSIGYSEKLFIRWQAPGEGSQKLNLNTDFPYILSTPVGAGYELLMNKQDSTFLSVKHKPSVNFKAYRYFSFSTFALIESNNVFIPVDPNNNHSNYLSDYKKTLYGLELGLKKGKTNYTYMDGWSVSTSFATGNRSINNDSDNSSLQAKSLQFATEISLNYHKRVWQQSLFAGSFRSNLQAGDKFLENELFRIGGFSSLKGFDENSIKCSSYGIITSEYRIYFAEDTYFSTIVNAAWVESNSIQGYNKGFPWGVAAGINFRTKPGILSAYYGLGKKQNESLEISNSKIHIGFVSLF